MRSETDIEVCMFRIFSSIRNADFIRDWFVLQGLPSVTLRRDIKSYPGLTDIVSAHNWPKRFNRNFVPPNGVSAFLSSKLVYSEAFEAAIEKSGNIRSTGYSKTTK